MSTPLQAIERLSGWFRRAAAPLWARTAWDTAHGGFFEALDFDGNPVRGPRRVRVQARQVYTFSMIGHRGWHDGAESIAAKGFEYLIRQGCPDDGARGCVHLLDDNGAVLDDRRDLYDQAFLLLACAARIETAKCDRAAALAEKTMAFLDRELASPHGGWNEDDKGALPRRQNPHMHLFEAFITLHRTTGEPLWRDKAGRIADLFARVFFEKESETLGEFFTEDLSRRAPQYGAIIEPGHMMEWAWLFSLYDRLAGFDNKKIMRTLYSAAKNHADIATGFLPDTVNGAVNGAGDAGARRLWPQTEYIKAAFTLSDAADDPMAHDGGAIINAALATYLDQPVDGLWCDQYNNAGVPMAVDVPASILYHLYEAVAVTQDYAQKIRQS